MYEDYMQNLLGTNFYPYQNTYDTNLRNSGCCNQSDNYEQYDYLSCNYDMNPNWISYSSAMPFNYTRDSINENKNIEDLYPEIYKIVYPMVQKACSKITRPVDEDLIDEIAKDIYSNIEADNIINLNINIDNNNSVNKVENRNLDNSISKTQTKAQENRSTENRQSRNPILSDLIRILLIRELFGRPGNRPPMPRPPRPPFPGLRSKTSFPR